MAHGGSDTRFAAVTQFIRRHRFLFTSGLLGAVGITSGGATAVAILQHPAARDILPVGSGFALAGLWAYLYLRHVALSLLVAFAPIPGLLIAAPLSGGMSFGLVPALAYAFAYGLAVTYGYAVAAGGRTGSPIRIAVATVVVAALLGSLWFWRSGLADAAVQAGCDIACATASVLLLMPAGGGLLVFDEAFVARTNRAREHGWRVFEIVALTATPRWGLSVAGIALIVAVLGWFGALPNGPHNVGAVWRSAVSLALIGTAGGLLCKGWREGVAAAIACLTAGLVALWGRGADAFTPVYILEIAAFALLAVWWVAMPAGRRQDSPSTARTRAVESRGPELSIATVGAAIVLLPAVLIEGSGATIAGMIVAGLGGVAFAPSLITALEVLVPRRRTVEELYGRR